MIEIQWGWGKKMIGVGSWLRVGVKLAVEEIGDRVGSWCGGLFYFLFILCLYYFYLYFIYFYFKKS